jgi:hypothetical protein
MTFKEASAFEMPFGKYRGQTLAKVCRDDDGPRYLSWFAGLDDLRPATREAIDCFMGDPDVKRLVQAALAAEAKRR